MKSIIIILAALAAFSAYPRPVIAQNGDSVVYELFAALNAHDGAKIGRLLSPNARQFMLMREPDAEDLRESCEWYWRIVLDRKTKLIIELIQTVEK